MKDIWAIILAAGESRRMGQPKMLLPFEGKTMIEKVIDNVSGSKVENLMVVLGAERESIVKIIGELPVRYCYNENYKAGMLSSVKCGFRNIPPNYAASLVFQGDQPLITSKVIDGLLRHICYPEKVLSFLFTE